MAFCIWNREQPMHRYSNYLARKRRWNNIVNNERLTGKGSPITGASVYNINRNKVILLQL